MPISIVADFSKLQGSADFIRRERSRFQAGLKQESEKFKFRWIRAVVDKYLSGPRPERLQPVSGVLRASISGSGASSVKEDGESVEIVVGTNVKYAPIHEFGGTVKTSITDKMRSWAWAKFYETKDSKYKGLALTKKSSIVRTIRKRPFLRPGLEDSLPGFEQDVEKRIREIRLAE